MWPGKHRNQIATSTCVKLFYRQQEEGRLEVGPTGWGRFVWALERWALVWPMVMGALSLFYLPDYLGRYSETASDSTIFWVSLLAVASFVSLLLAVMRFLRHERWIFDGESRELVYQTRTLYGTLQEASVDLRDIRKVEVGRGRGLGASTIVVEFAAGHREVLCKTRWGMGEVEGIAAGLRVFLKSARYDVEWVS